MYMDDETGNIQVDLLPYERCISREQQDQHYSHYVPAEVLDEIR